MNRVEAAANRAALRLRDNPQYNCWEVYTVILGSNKRTWIKIDEQTKNWYIQTFPDIKIVTWSKDHEPHL